MSRDFNFQFIFKNSVFATALGFCFILGCGASDTKYSTCLEDGDCTSQLDVKPFFGDIPESPGSKFWNSPQGPEKTTIDLGPQLITNPQWPDPFVKKVLISVARTETQFAVRLEWEDDTEDNGIGQSRLYTDQAAVMFPLNSNKEIPPITMGGEGFPVNIWQWKAVRQVTADAAQKDSNANLSPVEDLNAEGFSTLTRQDEQNVSGKGTRTNNGWQVVFKRDLKNQDEHDVQFAELTPMAVAIWNGGNRETNGQKGLAGWILLQFGKQAD
ncbi:MAG: ethylbenzene dehydrogenase-related protein [Nitrospinota bacterium]|nr:ethylbenzene dehydrogenase-related protein [Nitrospinota bacterium]